jgi:hypothetical protein
MGGLPGPEPRPAAWRGGTQGDASGPYAMPHADPEPPPFAVTLAASAFMAVLVPVYWWHYGVLHFLWLSDIALFATLLALWLRSRLLNSMMAIGVLPLEAYWNIDFFGRLLTGMDFAGVASYMFEEDRSLLLRGLSLFHVPMPVLWAWLLVKWGYDRRALVAQTLLLWAVIPATYLLTDPDDNINWVFAPQAMGWDSIAAPVWLVFYMTLVPLLVHWPLHRLFSRFFAAR